MTRKRDHRPQQNVRSPVDQKRANGGVSPPFATKIDALFLTRLVAVTLVCFLACATQPTKIEHVPATVRTCSKEADEALRRGDYQTSIILHEKLLEKEPDNLLALYHLGYTYGQLGQHEEEVVFYEKAFYLGFGTGNFFFNFGMALGELNRLDRALVIFQRGLDLEPENADILFGIALAHHRKGDYRAAEKAFIKVIELDPEQLEARLFLSLLYEEAGHRDKARDQLLKIMEMDPCHERAMRMLREIEKH